MASAEEIRSKLAELMKATVRDHVHWTYYAVRPANVPVSWKAGQHVTGDCSKGVQYLCKWAGAPDPMQNDFANWGNSQTLWTRLRHVPRASMLDVGDVVTFGHDGDEHAAMVLERGTDPLLWSFGHQGAPNTYRLSWDKREQQYLKLPLPDVPPTQIQMLRQRTGWFAWMAWRLGEGDWKKYGKASTAVRPNVPLVIPPTWWVRLAKFMANRNKGNPSKPH